MPRDAGVASVADTLCEYFEAGFISMQDHNKQSNDMELTDPVCGMKVTATSAHKHHHARVDYYFCCQGCQQKFNQNSDYYLSDAVCAPQRIAPAQPGNLNTTRRRCYAAMKHAV